MKPAADATKLEAGVTKPASSVAKPKVERARTGSRTAKSSPRRARPRVASVHTLSRAHEGQDDFLSQSAASSGPMIGRTKRRHPNTVTSPERETTMKRSAKLISMLTGFVAGMAKHYATPASLTLNDAATTTHDLATAFQAVIDADEAVKAADAKRSAAVAAANALAEGAMPEAKAFKEFVFATFGSNPATLADFDLQPRKVAVVPTAVRSAAAKKAAATRKALNTMGSKQKRIAKKELAAQPPAAPTPATAEPIVPAPAPTKA